MPLVNGATPDASAQPPANLIPVARALAPWLGRPHKATFGRWILKGVRTLDGRRIKLCAWRFGGRWMTTAAHAAEFIRATTTPSEPDLPPRSTTARRRASEDAECELRQRLGMKPNSNRAG